MSDNRSSKRRAGRLAVVLLAGASVLPAGCAGTRLPSLQPSSVQAEQRQAELFYPFAEEGAGPATESQPREYALPRTEATRLQRSNQYFIP